MSKTDNLVLREVYMSKGINVMLSSPNNSSSGVCTCVGDDQVCDICRGDVDPVEVWGSGKGSGSGSGNSAATCRRCGTPYNDWGECPKCDVGSGSGTSGNGSGSGWKPWGSGAGSGSGSGRGSGNHDSGGGENNGNPSTNPPSKVGDPNNVLAESKSYLETQIGYVKNAQQTPDVKDYLKVLNKAKSLIENINKNIEYNIYILINNKETGLNYDYVTKDVIVAIEDKFVDPRERMMMVAHELIHLEQLKRGDLWIENGEVIGYDIHDEVEAYQLQHELYRAAFAKTHDLMGNPVSEGNYKVTPAEIRKHFPDTYKDYPDKKVSKPK